MSYKKLYLTFLGILTMFVVGRVIVVSTLDIATDGVIAQLIGAIFIAHLIVGLMIASIAWQRMISRDWYFEFQMTLGWFVASLFSIGGVIGYAVLLRDPGTEWMYTPAIALMIFAQIGMVQYYKRQSDAKWYHEHKQRQWEDDDSFRMKL